MANCIANLIGTELMKEVELKRFIAQLKKTLLATNADKADKCMSLV